MVLSMGDRRRRARAFPGPSGPEVADERHVGAGLELLGTHEREDEIAEQPEGDG